MIGTAPQSAVSLDELRSRLACRLALLPLIIAGGVITWRLFAPGPFPVPLLQGTLALVALGWGVRSLDDRHPALARYVLAGGLTLALLAGLWQLADTWVPFLGVALAFVSSLLVSGGEFWSTAAVAGAAVLLNRTGSRAYPTVELLAALALGLVIAWLGVRTLYMAIEWVWEAHHRADHLLELARDRQGQLGKANRSLDLTNSILRRTQRELIVARKQADEARRMKEHFAANVSHELRTPLNLVLGFSEMMYLSPEVYGELDWPATLRRDVYQIYRASRHLLDMINDILDLSRLEMVGFALHRQPTPLGPLLREAVDIAADLFRDRPVQLMTSIGDDLPALSVDRIRVRQILLNLLSNAARLTEEGYVRVTASVEGPDIVVSVTDTGPGIPADALSHLFDEFYQVDHSLHRRSAGAGLGLAISKHFVEAHEGHIHVESEEGAGSTFSFSLPLPDGHAPVSRLEAGRAPGVSGNDSGPPLLVVDPDPTVGDWLAHHLDGYAVVPVTDPHALGDAITLYHPRAIVRNVRPDSAHDQQSGCSAPVPVIDCALPSSAWMAQDAGVVDCLIKPISSEGLLRVLGRLDGIREVLVVDDDRDFCQLVERILQSTGRPFQLYSAYSGEDALLALQEHAPDLVLLDIIMPEMDGLETLARMRGELGLRNLPVVLLTATSLAEDSVSRLGSRLVVDRTGGLSLAETLRCLRALVDVLEPEYDERWASEAGTVGGGGPPPAVSPAGPVVLPIAARLMGAADADKS